MTINKTPHATAQAATTLSALAVLSPLAGVAAEISLAWRFGASPTVDAFRIGTLVLFFGQQVFVNQILPHTIVPIFAEYRSRGEEKEAWRVAMSLANLLLIPALLFSFCVFLYPEPVVEFLAPGLAGEARATASLFLRWFLLTCGVMVWSGVAAGVLYAHGIVWLPPVAQLAGNIALVLLILGLGRRLGAASLVIGVLLAAAFGAALYAVKWIPLMRAAGARWTWTLEVSHPGVRKAFQLALPMLGSILVGQWAALVVNRALSMLPPGNLARFGYTWKLGQLVALAPLALATVLFPRIAETHVSSLAGEFRNFCTRALRMALFVSLPLACVLYPLRSSVVALLLERGAFSSGASAGVALLFGLLLLGAPASAAVFFLEKMLYAAQHTRWPLWAQLAGALLIVFGSAPAATRHGAAGLMLLVGAVAVWVNAAILFWVMESRYRALAGKQVIGFATGILLVALVSGWAARWAHEFLRQGVPPGPVSSALATAVGLAVGGAVFFGSTLALRVPEALACRNYLRWQGSATAKRLQEFVLGRT